MRLESELYPPAADVVELLDGVAVFELRELFVDDVLLYGFALVLAAEFVLLELWLLIEADVFALFEVSAVVVDGLVETELLVVEEVVAGTAEVEYVVSARAASVDERDV